MPIKNYTTKISAAQTLGEIQAELAKHGAKRILVDYEAGEAVAITFAVECSQKDIVFRLEARTAGVVAALAKERKKCDARQAEAIAWRNIKDWVTAQIALIEAEQAALDELFLPMMVSGENETLYGAYCRRGELMLADSNSQRRDQDAGA